MEPIVFELRRAHFIVQRVHSVHKEWRGGNVRKSRWIVRSYLIGQRQAHRTAAKLPPVFALDSRWQDALGKVKDPSWRCPTNTCERESQKPSRNLRNFEIIRSGPYYAAKMSRKDVLVERSARRLGAKNLSMAAKGDGR